MTASETVYTRENVDAMRTAVHDTVERTPITDIHTHLYAPAFGDLLLWGVDELLIYHYLIAEVIRASRIDPAKFYAKSKREQADFMWQTLFIERSPFSEARRGVLTVLDKLGLDVASRDLAAYREYFAQQTVENYIDTVFEKANLKSVVMTNDPFDDKERPVWESGVEVDKRFHAALRIDPVLNDWTGACARLKEWGYDVDENLSAKTLKETRRFLSDWLKKTRALYMAVSLPQDFMFPEDSPRAKLMAECIVPVTKEHNVPFAMMIGVKRAMNPALKLAGDGVAKSDVGSVERLCVTYPDTKFMVTMLAREDQHELSIAARKFPNLFLFGCWWFLNVPSLIEEITRMRLELLGSSVMPQHSDARVLDQVIYKWSHSRAIIAKVLADKYADLLGTGWVLKQSEIDRDVAELLGENFWHYLK
ncbi:MAG: glucuronate isomerase [Candidatus Hydrogenedentes bacterium]|nr:glucuronate isomerase [Candidatus Hydrogenedentota bacterium]